MAPDVHGRSPLRMGFGLRVASTVVASITVVAVVLYSLRQAEPLVAGSISLLVAAASALAGTLIGFVFGVPRVLATDRPRTAEDDDGSTTIVGNTNLEQISDWLTKILVGVGLTQFSAIGAGALRLVREIGPSVGPGISGEVFVGALMLSSSSAGFIAGWLAARLWLGRKMAEADANSRVINLMRAAERASQAGDDETAEQLREQAQEVLEQRNAISHSYEVTRSGMRPGHERTARMDRIVDDARSLARRISITADDVAKLLRDGSAGEHITALGFLQERPELARAHLLVTIIEDPASPFEQYHALRAALKAMPHLDPAERGLVVDAAVRARPGMGRDGYRTRLVTQLEAAAAELAAKPE